MDIFGGKFDEKYYDLYLLSDQLDKKTREFFQGRCKMFKRRDELLKKYNALGFCCLGTMIIGLVYPEELDGKEWRVYKKYFKDSEMSGYGHIPSKRTKKGKQLFEELDAVSDRHTIWDYAEMIELSNMCPFDSIFDENGVPFCKYIVDANKFVLGIPTKKGLPENCSWRNDLKSLNIDSYYKLKEGSEVLSLGTI